jgi:hypothetical protein
MDGHLLYRGIAPGVLLFSADAGSYYPYVNIQNASLCVVNSPHLVDILNLSFGGYEPGVEIWTRFFDYIVWAKRRTVITASGNNGGEVAHPAAGYNVITVGGFNDYDTPIWQDDDMWDQSSYQGPGNRDKPEIVAVADTLCIGLENPYESCPYSGTSYAAPQVSGLAALMMERIGQKREPEMIKAIIMTSAVHNVEGHSRLSDQDGVGGIDGALAFQIAEHGKYGVAPDGWYESRTVYNGTWVDNRLHYYVPISKGQRVRAVLAYDSHPDANYENDVLFSDLDLRVNRPDGTQISVSASTDNSFEIVEFTADVSGTYDIIVHRFNGNSVEYIGLAWIKELIALPDTRYISGWDSQIKVLNLGAQPQDVHVTFSNGDDTIWGGSTVK